MTDIGSVVFWSASSLRSYKLYVRYRTKRYLQQVVWNILYYARSAVVHSQEADELRRQLESARDSTARELTFTRSELEKYQRDYASASKQVLFAVITRKNWPCFGQLQRTFQVQHLLFVLERERRGDEEMSNNDEDNARLFDNIAQLQK